MALNLGKLIVLKATKEHRCKHCKETLELGARYVQFVQSFSKGDKRFFYTDRIHLDCIVAHIEKISEKHPDKLAGRPKGASKWSTLTPEVKARRKVILNRVHYLVYKMMKEDNVDKCVPWFREMVELNNEHRELVGENIPQKGKASRTSHMFSIRDKYKSSQPAAAL